MVPASQPAVPVFLTFQLTVNCSRDLKWLPFLTDCTSTAQSSVPEAAGPGDCAGVGPGGRVDSGVLDGAEVGESAGEAVIDGVGVRARVDAGVGVGGAAQDDRKSASAMKAIVFLIYLPFPFFDTAVLMIR